MSELPNADKLRERLHANFSEALSGDPACNGRVCTATLDYLADEALRACEAVFRHAQREGWPQ